MLSPLLFSSVPTYSLFSPHFSSVLCPLSPVPTSPPSPHGLPVAGACGACAAARREWLWRARPLARLRQRGRKHLLRSHRRRSQHDGRTRSAPRTLLLYHRRHYILSLLFLLLLLLHHHLLLFPSSLSLKGKINILLISNNVQNK